MRKIPVFLIVFALFLPIILGTPEYSTIGKDALGTFSAGLGYWTPSLQDVWGANDTKARSGTFNLNHTILVDDFDLDGNYELFVLNGATGTFYRTKNLITNNSVAATISASYRVVSNFEAIDMNNDTYKEIYYATSNSTNALNIEYIEWNASAGAYQHHMKNEGVSVYDMNNMAGLKCESTKDNCLLYFLDETSNIGYHVFSWGNFSNGHFIMGINHCLPAIPSISVYDMDMDGIMEMIFTASLFKAGDDEAYLFAYSVAGGTISPYFAYKTITITDTLIANCNLPLVSAPIVYDIGDAGAKEIIFAQMASPSEFNIAAYSDAGVLKDFSLDYGGVFLSNPFAGNVVGDVDGDEICILGYENGTGVTYQFQALCENNNFIGDTANILFDQHGEVINISEKNHMVTHIMDNDGDSAAGGSMEILTAYGIDEVISGDCGDSGISCETEELFSFDLASQIGVMYPVDVEDTGYNDLLYVTPSYIYYLDDQFSNTAPSFTWSLNPCINERMGMQNTSVVLTVSPTDIDNDAINVTASFYYGLPENQTQNQTSGYIFTFLANETGIARTLRITAYDTIHSASPTTEDIIFSITTDENAVSYGDCTSTGGTAPEGTEGTAGDTCEDGSDCAVGYYCTEDGECTAFESDEDTAIAGKIKDGAGKYGMTPMILVLLVLFIVTLGAIYEGISYKWSGGAIMAAVLALDGFILIAAALFDFISAGAVITLFILVIGAGALAFMSIIRK